LLESLKKHFHHRWLSLPATAKGASLEDPWVE
jgi:hypothetical protein